ncbi:MAG: TonB-dependent receptor [Candidatus Solibacter usitatus]|nr:TonB-dependent receptor [Candidatus Solibacter usitatus]
MLLGQFRSLLVFAALFAATCFAQIGTSTITGRVIDSTGAVVPGVSVNAIQLGTNFKNTTPTNAEGLYRIQSLQPGKYRLTFEAAGFKKSVRDEVELHTGDTLAVDMSLQVGNVSESIEVTGAVALLETETSATGTVISGNVLYDMPLYQRYINSTLNLVPGMTTGGYAYGGDLGSYHLAGQRSGAIGIFEDGVNANDQNSGTGTIKPIQNSTAEVKVLTTVPPAEYGHSAGGVISVAKKSGTNEIHGMGSFYGRTRSMQHRLFFDQIRTSQPTPGRPNGVPVFFMMPDANISGPVMIPKLYDGRNKTFFFFGYQRLHEKKVAQVDTAVPTPGMRAGDFNFPGFTTNQIFDPATTRFVGGTWLRDPFAGNIIPQNRIDPVARKILEYDPWVQPNRPGTITSLGPNSNYLADEFAKVFFDDFNLRLDHQFSTNLKTYFSWTINVGSGFQRPWNIRMDRPEFDGAAGNFSPSRNQNMSLGKTWIMRPNIVNDARVGYYRRWSEVAVPSFQQNWAQKLGIPNVNADLMPAFGSGNRIAVSSMFGLIGATPSRTVNETLSLRDDLSIIHGKHAFKMGYEILKFRLNSAVHAIPVSFDFGSATNGLQASGNSVPNTGNPFAGLLTGYVNAASFRTELSSWLPRSSINSFYFQDDWKVTPRLTANIGVRYSNESPYNTKWKAMSQFDPLGTDALTGGRGAVLHPVSGLNRRDNNNFNPRLGLAWHPLQKWVFRGGVGFYSVDVKFPAGRDQFDEYAATALQQAAPGDPTPVYQISRGVTPQRANILPNGTSPFLGTNYGGRGVSYWDPNLRNPYVMNWNLSVQHEVTRDYLIEVSYQGSSGVGLLERWELNTFPVDFAANDPALRDRVFAAAQNFRPYPNFGGINMRSNFGHSTFHSGTVKLEKRMSKGLYFLTFYTYSRAIDTADGDNSGGGVAPIQNRSLEKGRAGFDRAHRYIGTVNWELPFGKNRRFSSSNRVANWIMGGMELSFIQTVESGNPLNFSFNNSPNNYYPGFAGARRPNLVSTPVYDFGKWNNGGGDRFSTNNRPAVIDMNAFAYPAAFTVGNAGRNILTGPRLVWAQISAQKNFQIRERVKAQLRWDIQNAFKTFNFTGPTNTVDFRNPQTFGKLLDDPRTASLGGQPLMNLTFMMQF